VGVYRPPNHPIPSPRRRAACRDCASGNSGVSHAIILFMSKLRCLKCETEYEGTQRAQCPECLLQMWESNPDFFGKRGKHDDSLSTLWPRDRSVTKDTHTSGSAYARTAAYCAQPFYHTGYKNTTYLLPKMPDKSVPGLLIPSGNVTAISGVPSLAVVEGHNPSAHMYSPTAIRTGQNDPLIPYSICPVSGCNNLSYNYQQPCGQHINQPKAQAQ
jgi:hypothetical protein